VQVNNVSPPNGAEEHGFAAAAVAGATAVPKTRTRVPLGAGELGCQFLHAQLHEREAGVRERRAGGHIEA
jgi:hypothetical protein